MRILVPLCPVPGEFLETRPDEFMELALRALRTAMDVATALPEGAQIIVAHQRLGATALGRLPKAATELVGLAPSAVTEEELPFLPPGTSAALERLGPPAQAEPMGVLNLRNPRLRAEDLLGAYARFAQTAIPLLFSATAPQDHPCQGRSLYSLDGPLRPLGEGARIDGGTAAASTVVLDRPDTDVPRQALLVLMGHGEKLLLTDRVPSARQAAFNLPTGVRIPAEARWALALPHAAPGPGRFLLPHVPGSGAWGMNPRSGRITDAAGRDIAGRQDFPPLLRPDGSFCLFAAQPLPDSETARWRHQTWELPPERSQLITHPLALVAWRLATKDRDKDATQSRPART